MKGLLEAAFPARYGPGAWAPALAACAAFLALEAALHDKHGAALGMSADPLRLLWEGLYAAGFLSYLAPLALPVLRREPGFLRRTFVGFGLQLLLGGGWYFIGPDWARLEPCLLVANAVFVSAVLSRRLEWVRDSSAAAGVASLALATIASNRHDAVDVAVGAAIGWTAFRVSVSPALAVLSTEVETCDIRVAPPRASVAAGDLLREQVLTGVCLALGLAAGFYFIDGTVAARAAAGVAIWAPVTAWDRLIPFSSVWIWPYLLYFPLCLTPLLLARVRSDTETFRGTARGFLLQFAAAFSVFLLFPSGVSLPAPIGEGLSADALRLLHRLDPGFNVFPSLHVANAVFVASLFSRFGGWAASVAVWGAALLVAASTVLVKQHYLADLPAGAALGAAAFLLSFPASQSTPELSGARRPWLRASFGAGLALVPAAIGGLFGASTGAAAGLGHLAACVALFLARAGGPAAGWAAVGTFATAVLLIRPESAPAAVFGAVAGAAAWGLAFWEQMIFLDDDAPLARLRHQLDEALNVFVRSDAGRWDRMYAGGQWEFLHGGELAPLYAAAADFLRRGAPAGARVVDLGCGNGALLPSLRAWHRGYLGVDLSAEAVARARRAGLRPGEEMRVQPVEEFSDFSGFEAAVFNEVLYYLPVDKAVRAVRAAVEGLRTPGVVVVVMTDNPKARRIWAALDAWRTPVERRAFRVIASEPSCELRRY